jgi:ABC-type lipoprotein export system ATPase subunit
VGLPSEVQPPAIIAFANVSKTYPARNDSAKVVALDQIHLRVSEGAIVGIIGKSGAGKSTLIRMINGLERPSGGQVLVNGTDVTVLDERGLRQARRSIGMIFQHFNLLSSRSVFENIALPLEIAGCRKSETAKVVEPLLAMVGLADKRDRYPAELSGGQKQRVGIARALATKPKILLSDEATSALDPEAADEILSLLKTINAELKLTVVFITHEMSVVKSSRIGSPCLRADVSWSRGRPTRYLPTRVTRQRGSLSVRSPAAACRNGCARNKGPNAAPATTRYCALHSSAELQTSRCCRGCREASVSTSTFCTGRSKR